MDQIQSDGPVSEEILADLIQRAQCNSDPEAFEGLYLCFADRVYRYLLVRLGDVEAAEEITSQVFVRLIEKIDTFTIAHKDNVAIFSAWLYRLARNMMVDVLRAEKRYRRAATEYTRHVEHNKTLSVNDRLALEDVMRKLRCLNDQQQEVIICRFIEELSIAETARIMRKTEAAVKALQQRALENLRRLGTV